MQRAQVCCRVWMTYTAVDRPSLFMPWLIDRVYLAAHAWLNSPEESERVGKLLPKLSIGLNMIFAMASMFMVCYVGASSIYKATHQVCCCSCFPIFGLSALFSRHVSRSAYGNSLGSRTCPIVGLSRTENGSRFDGPGCYHVR